VYGLQRVRTQTRPRSHARHRTRAHRQRCVTGATYEPHTRRHTRNIRRGRRGLRAPDRLSKSAGRRSSAGNQTPRARQSHTRSAGTRTHTRTLPLGKPAERINRAHERTTHDRPSPGAGRSGGTLVQRSPHGAIGNPLRRRSLSGMSRRRQGAHVLGLRMFCFLCTRIPCKNIHKARLWRLLNPVSRTPLSPARIRVPRHSHSIRIASATAEGPYTAAHGALVYCGSR
jgi:hypothetical protein